MPLYDFRCVECGHEDEVFFMMSQVSGATPACSRCGSPMNRVWHPDSAPTPSVFQAHYNHGLGTYVSSPGQMKEAVRRINGETGQKLVPVGDSDCNVKPRQRKEYLRGKDICP